MHEAIAAFEKAAPFFEAAKASMQTARCRLQLSGERLGFEIDPFLLPISSHRQMRLLNENAYMDWFAWVLDVACENTPHPLSLCTKILLDEEPSPQASGGYGDKPKIMRELPVDKGDEGRAGRLDLLIVFPDKKSVFHIEAKVVDAESAYLDKNDGYSSYLEKYYQGCRNFLLTTGCQKSSYSGFVSLTWDEICARIRQWVAERSGHGLSNAMLLLFCAIVEQQLGALKVGSTAQIAYLEQMKYMKGA